MRQKAATGATDNMVPPQLRLARARKTRRSPRTERHLSLAEMSVPTSSPQPEALAARALHSLFWEAGQQKLMDGEDVQRANPSPVLRLLLALSE